MTSDFHKKKLPSEPAIKYLQEILVDTNLLSTFAWETIDFSKGAFFTLAPKTTPKDTLHFFNTGIFGKATRKEFSIFLHNYLSKNPKLYCIFDDILKKPTDPFINIEGTITCVFNEEIYHILSPPTITPNILMHCMQKTHALWHSLCIITNLKESTTITRKSLRSICEETHLLAIGAYDGEGYIFWERNNHDIAKEAQLLT